MSARRAIAVALTIVGLMTGERVWAEAPADDRVVTVEQYTSEKARRLATTYDRALRELSAEIYHCLPYLDINRRGIGFFKPKHVQEDERYLGLNVTVDQQPAPEFSKFSREERVSRMFSRYVGPLLRRMVRDRTLLADPALDGFTVIVSWQKETAKPGERPINETIAAFMKKSLAAKYLTGRAPIGQLADGAYVLAWDGETPLGPIHLTAWDDNFIETYKIANYQPEAGVKCG